MVNNPVSSVPADDMILQELDLIVASRSFAKSKRMKALLGYLVAEALAGRGHLLKEYKIGLDVFDRDTSFDPQSSPIVRVEVSRLRRRLEQYYLSEGAADPIRIELPRGAYVPKFALADIPTGSKATMAKNQLAFGTWLTLPGVALLIVVLNLLFTVAMISRAGEGQQGIALAQPNEMSIAVLPFITRGDGPDKKHIADGITDEILNGLVRFKDLAVFSGDAPLEHEGQAIDVRRLRHELGVDFVLRGSVRHVDQEIRITAQFLHAGTGLHLWSCTHDDNLSTRSVLAIQKKFSGYVVAALGDGAVLGPSSGQARVALLVGCSIGSIMPTEEKASPWRRDLNRAELFGGPTDVEDIDADDASHDVKLGAVVRF